MGTAEAISMENLSFLLEKYKAFIIRTISDMTGRYVSVENDDEYSIALSAFMEAVEKFDEKKGTFISFARLVIQSRLKNHWEAQKKGRTAVSLDALRETGLDFAEPMEQKENRQALVDEIKAYTMELSLFGLDLETLAENAPRHRDTRTMALEIADEAGKDEGIVTRTYEKKRLPIRDVSRLCEVSEKIVKGNRFFILGSMLIFVKKFLLLLQWVQTGR